MLVLLGTLSFAIGSCDEKKKLLQPGAWNTEICGTDWGPTHSLELSQPTGSGK